jgi:hypothetical protein
MSSTTQIVLDVDREKQVDRAKKARPDLAKLATSEVVKKLFFEKLDEVAGANK